MTRFPLFLDIIGGITIPIGIYCNHQDSSWAFARLVDYLTKKYLKNPRPTTNEWEGKHAIAWVVMLAWELYWNQGEIDDCMRLWSVALTIEQESLGSVFWKAPTTDSYTITSSVRVDNLPGWAKTRSSVDPCSAKIPDEGFLESRPQTPSSGKRRAAVTSFRRFPIHTVALIDTFRVWRKTRVFLR